MARYFFNVHDDENIRDDEGVDFADPRAARDAAIRLAGAILRDLGGRFKGDNKWSLEMTDEAGGLLLTLHFSEVAGFPTKVRSLA